MTQNRSYTTKASSSPIPASFAQAAIYTHPEQVANDRRLTKSEKKEILASWVSDARAVENAPSLRHLDSGAIVDVDAILRVLVALDGSASGSQVVALPLRRRGVVKDWLRKYRPWRGLGDDDDDPPPAPAGLAVPFRPVFTASYAPGAAAFPRDRVIAQAA